MKKTMIKRRKNARPQKRKSQGKPVQQDHDRLIPGFHAVRETLNERLGNLQEIWIAEGKLSPRMEEIREPRR
jgi:tRNA G18 (ribose-2'-O)-methylase SpoU